MNDSKEQLSFLLKPQDPYALKYFVPHSGVAAAYAALGGVAETAASDLSQFHMVYLCGPSGSGKTHLLKAVLADLDKLSVPREKCRLVNIDEDLKSGSELRMGEFVSDYNVLKASGGVFLAEGSEVPSVLNPHIGSRLLSGQVFELAYPEESELEPLLKSLLERRNMRITDYSLQYLLRRLPRDLLSFDNIFARVSELSFSETRPAGLGVIRRAVEENLENNQVNNLGKEL